MVTKNSLLHKLDPAQVLAKAILRLAKHYHLSRKELGAIIGMSEATLSRLYSGHTQLTPQSKSGELALLLLRLYRSLNAILGDNDQKASLWLKSHNHYFGETPLQHIHSIAGLVMVVNYLDAMREKL